VPADCPEWSRSYLVRYEKYDCNRVGDSGHYDDRTAGKRFLGSKYSDECESGVKSLNEV
jgi:hypothetical protein